MLTLNSRPQTTFEGPDSSTVIDSNVHQTDGSIQAIWQDDLERRYSIDTSLQQYSQQLSSSNTNNQGPIKPFHDNTPLSPSAPSLARSSSSSSIATNHSTESSTSASSPLYPTGIATQAFDLISSSLDQPVSPAVTDSPATMNNNALNHLESQSSSVQYGQYLTPDHIDKTKLMVKELVTQSLVPFMERNIQHWNEQVASARRGITGRLFGASRRLFGTNQSRNPSPQSIQTIPASGKNVPAGVNSLVM